MGAEKDMAVNEMVAPVTVAVTLSPQQEAFAPAVAVAAATPVPSGSSHPAAVEAAEAEILEAKRTAETAAAAAAALDVSAAAASPALDVSAAAAAASAALDAQATSETVSSTLMGIALLAYLQGSSAKHEARGGGGYGSVAAPSSSQGGIAATRPAAGAGAHPYERLPPRRYQRMSPVDTEAPTEPLTRMLEAIKATQSKAQYTCKRYVEEEGEGKERERTKEKRSQKRKNRKAKEEEVRERERERERVLSMVPSYGIRAGRRFRLSYSR